MLSQSKGRFDLLQPLRKWLEAIEVEDPKFARLLCKLIPSQCPFAKEIKFCQRTILRIPPLCKLNPLYDQIVYLRFKALTYLVDVCGENVLLYS
ncbi:MAG: Mo-dependent nitrogenase C-terminal domain-containing protein [Cyanosarcina radialis HA8281-LM2]|jgi:hypothetical protein|nr:Mo-dependent nitrogenase C-terminal domain-containing protein [Cyanosarcina radialis HA8281-LM2]